MEQSFPLRIREVSRSRPDFESVAHIAGAFFLGALVIVLCSCISPTTANDSRIYISVQEFEGRRGVTQAECRRIADRVAALLNRTGRFALVDRSQALVNKAKQVSSNSTTEERKDTSDSKALPIRKMIYGSIARLGEDSYSLIVKMVDVETSSVDVDASKIYRGDLAELPDNFLDEIVREIARVGEGTKTHH